MVKMKVQLAIIIFSIFCICSCGDTPDIKDAPDVDHIEVADVVFVRYDKLVQAMDTLDIKGSYNSLLSEHPNITKLYFDELLNFKSESQDSFMLYVNEFVKAEPIVDLQKTVDEIYPNTKSIEKDLNKAQKYFKYYFPLAEMPVFYTYITEFGYQTIIFNDGDYDGIGIGLDLYLGDGFDYKKVDPRNPVFSDYLTRSYNEEHIVRNVMELITSDIMGEPKGQKMLDQMIFNGKRLYIMEKLLPWVSDSIILEQSSDNFTWLENNELQIWDYFLEQDLIYETSHLKINKYLNPSPHSPGMPKEAPGQTATYIGWKIVHAYMNRHPEASPLDLLSLTDNQKLLELSKYKPKRR
jgi:hypothetical protein